MHRITLVCVAAIAFCATAVAQKPTDSCGPAKVIPLTGEEPPAKIFIDPPLAEPLASRGVAIIHYCAQNLRLLPVFGPNALAVTPRIGHVHVRLDDAPWVWMEGSDKPIILGGLPAGPHTVRFELMDANHRKLDEGTVSFVVPGEPAAEKHH
ncbi:MAG TPA: DUF6130 family protein [Chthoniobacterales bacterium]|jgi:hypothetical protein